MRKLFNDDVRAPSKANIVETRAFRRLIQLARDVRPGSEATWPVSATRRSPSTTRWRRTNQRRGDGGTRLRVIAQELLKTLQESVSVDWAHQGSARARMRLLAKHLRKYGYPPDPQDAAAQKVLQQAEALSAEWSPGR